MDQSKGYIYIRRNEWMDQHGIYKVGKTLNIPDRDQGFITHEIIRGTFVMIFEIESIILDNLENQLKVDFKNLNYYINSGTEYFKRKIIDYIIPYFDRNDIKYRKLSKDEIEGLNRKKRIQDNTSNDENTNEQIENIKHNKIYEPRDYQETDIQNYYEYFQTNGTIKEEVDNEEQPEPEETEEEVYVPLVQQEEGEESDTEGDPVPVMEEQEEDQVEEEFSDAGSICSDTEEEEQEEIDENYNFDNFLEDLKDFQSRKQKDFIDNILPKYNKVFFHFKDHKDFIYKSRDGIKFESPNTALIRFAFKMNDKKKVIGFQDILKNYSKYIHLWDNFGFYPNGKNYRGEDCPANILNTWNGFQGTFQNDFNLDLIQPILSHLKSCWADDDGEIYEYLLDWLAHIIQFPYLKTKVIIILYSSMQQVGKNILTDFLCDFVFGSELAYSCVGTSDITATFNINTYKKIFVNCNELSAFDHQDRNSQFDNLKSIITDPKKTYEVKNGIKFSGENYANFLATTNHSFTYKVESGDARVFPLNVSNRFHKDFEYFKKLGKHLNQETGDMFYTFLKNRDISKRILTDIPYTELKEQMKQNSLSSPLRFCKAVKEDNSILLEFNEERLDKFPTKLFFEKFKNWCSMNDEKQMSSTAFAKIILERYTRRKSNGYMYYNLDDLKQ